MYRPGFLQPEKKESPKDDEPYKSWTNDLYFDTMTSSSDVIKESGKKSEQPIYAHKVYESARNRKRKTYEAFKSCPVDPAHAEIRKEKDAQNDEKRFKKVEQAHPLNEQNARTHRPVDDQTDLKVMHDRRHFQRIDISLPNKYLQVYCDWSRHRRITQKGKNALTTLPSSH